MLDVVVRRLKSQSERVYTDFSSTDIDDTVQCILLLMLVILLMNLKNKFLKEGAKLSNFLDGVCAEGDFEAKDFF